jgi:hypothetical protein
MNIVEGFGETAGKVRAGVHGYRQAAVETARKRVSRAAGALQAARGPVNTLLSATQRLSDLTHGAVVHLLKQNAASLDGAIRAGAQRLEDLAQAKDLTSFLREQAALNPAVRERLSLELDQLKALARRTGRDVGALASETYAELIHGVSSRAKPAVRRKSTRRTVKKTTRARRAH